MYVCIFTVCFTCPFKDLSRRYNIDWKDNVKTIYYNFLEKRCVMLKTKLYSK